MDKLDKIIQLIEHKNGICLSRERLKPIYEQLVPCKKGKHEILSQIGDVNQNMYIVVDGIIRLYYIDIKGNDITRYFGEKGSVGGLNSDILPYALETLVPSELLVGNFETIRTMVQNDIYWIKIWNQLLQNSIQYKIYRESSFLMKSATQRYLDFKRMYPGLEKDVSQAHIASYLGISPVSLSRIRRAIKKEIPKYW